ncbi:LppP/LprE family lipoprotein [Gordonia sp. SID5947]|uniref:LppP/LprE family lipoprotein n=1 Tax=Gordonia sp. SID5947 TaxID=2690315 RepID=UPI00136C93F6|nr:LppP/LprE family lipoprotein [Gordonia sp. SID5947]MYR07781.1 LppP/LprE family lipoprotein [Gordonia sp. SID5947]
MSSRRSNVSRLVIAAAAAMFTISLAAPAASAAPAADGHPVAGTAGHGLCLDLSSSEVQRGLRAIGPPLGRSDLRWVPRNGPMVRSTDRTPNCPPLMWATFDTSGGTVSSPTAVLLFRPGKYLGVTNRPTGYTKVSEFTPFSVTVAYRWPQRNDANANPTGGPVSSFFFQVFDRVYRFGDLPPGV